MNLEVLREWSGRGIRMIPLFLRPVLLGLPLFLLMHLVWSAGVDDSGARERIADARPAPSRRPAPHLDLDTVRAAIENHESFTEFKKAVLPKRLPDDYTVIGRWRIVQAGMAAGYIKATEDTSTGIYSKVYELTSSGYHELFREYVDEPERYVFTLARRRLDSFGTVRPASDSVTERSFHVQFYWTWEPVNELGRRMDLGPPGRDTRFRGSVSVVKSASGVEISDLDFGRDDPDLMVAQ